MRTRTREWRHAMTPGEESALEPIEREIAVLRERLLILQARYHRIQNRATVRAGKSDLPKCPPRCINMRDVPGFMCCDRCPHRAAKEQAADVAIEGQGRRAASP